MQAQQFDPRSHGSFESPVVLLLAFSLLRNKTSLFQRHNRLPHRYQPSIGSPLRCQYDGFYRRAAIFPPAGSLGRIVPPLRSTPGPARGDWHC